MILVRAVPVRNTNNVMENCKPIQVVAGLLKRDDKILIACRPPDKPYSGYWELPGGKIEANEASFVALQRELKEEIGITVHEASCWFEHEHRYPDKFIHLELWHVSDYEGEPQSLEKQTLLWATLDEIKSLRILEGNVAILERLREFMY